MTSAGSMCDRIGESAILRKKHRKGQDIKQFATLLQTFEVSTKSAGNRRPTTAPTSRTLEIQCQS